jgi:hypothetical protein
MVEQTKKQSAEIEVKREAAQKKYALINLEKQ